MNRYAPPVHELEQITRPKGAPAEWGYCGIAAMSSVTGIPPLEIYNKIPDWKGYTPSRTIIQTLTELGYEVNRALVKKPFQRKWPSLLEYPSVFKTDMALGRIYFGEGKYAGSHWICFYWHESPSYPYLYDNCYQDEKWRNTTCLEFYEEPIRLKSLYFVKRKTTKDCCSTSKIMRNLS